jgi:hypothetical protein
LNRFSGFPSCAETAEAVKVFSAFVPASLKRGVDEMWRKSARKGALLDEDIRG